MRPSTLAPPEHTTRARRRPIGRRRRRTGVLVLALALCAPATAVGPAQGAPDVGPDDTRARRSTAVGWQPPVPGDVVRDAHLPARPWLPGHRGIDLATAPGAAVVAPAHGTVTFAGQVAGRPVLVVSHGTLRSTFEPVDAVVPVGTTVTAGAQVGVVTSSGPSHCPPAHCVHWGVRRGEQYLDPAVLLGRAEPVVLLPVD